MINVLFQSDFMGVKKFNPLEKTKDLNRIEFKLGLFYIKESRFLKINLIDFRNYRYEACSERKSVWVRFADAITFDITNEEEFDYLYQIYLKYPTRYIFQSKEKILQWYRESDSFTRILDILPRELDEGEYKDMFNPKSPENVLNTEPYKTAAKGNLSINLFKFYDMQKVELYQEKNETNVDVYKKYLEEMSPLEKMGIYGLLIYIPEALISKIAGKFSAIDFERYEKFRLSCIGFDTYNVLEGIECVDKNIIAALREGGRYKCPYFQETAFNANYPLFLVGNDIFPRIKDSIHINSLTIETLMKFKPSSYIQEDFKRDSLPSAIGLARMGHGYSLYYDYDDGKAELISLKIKLGDEFFLVVNTFEFHTK